MAQAPCRTKRRTRRAPAFARRLVLMVKMPVLGRTKTRLAREIGAVGATAFYRHTVSAVLGRLATAPQWRTILCVAPDAAAGSRIWPARLERIPQGHGDLGRRMQRAMDRLRPGPIVIIGTDIPGVRPEHVGAAFRALGSHDAVFGPSPDGGYWLVGLKRMPRVPRVFAGVRWSSAHALADTLRNAAGLRVAEVAGLADVDQAADLKGLGGACGRRILPLSARSAAA